MGASLTRGLALFTALAAASPGCGRQSLHGGMSEESGQGSSAEPADSSSLIVRAAHILDVQIAKATLGPWGKDTERTRKRRADLDLVLERALKGAVRERPGSHARVVVEQIEPAGERYVAVPGVWSGVDVSEGARVVVFSRSTSSSMSDVLQERMTERVVPDRASVAAVELAMAAERDHLSLPATLDRAHASRASLGALFAEYVNARLGEVLFADPVGFNAVASFVESSTVPVQVRGIVLRELFARFIQADPAPAPFVDRLALASFRVLGQADAQLLHGELVSVLLPNLLGVRGGAAKRSATEVFRDAPADRAAAERALASLPDTRAAQPMLAWIRS